MGIEDDLQHELTPDEVIKAVDFEITSDNQLPKRRKRTLNLIPIGELLVKKYEEREKILSPWLPTKGITMVYASRGVGKTYFALHVACAVATGKTLMGWTVDRPCSVLYIDGEMPATDMQERLEEMVSTCDYTLNGNNIYFYTNDEQDEDSELFNLTDSFWQDQLEKALNMMPEVKLIIVDNIATVCRGMRESDNNDWQEFIQPWALRMRKQGRTVLFIHHTGKNGEQRGGSGKEDVLDTSIQLKHPSDYEPEQGARFEVHFKKNRGFSGDAAKPILAQMSDGFFETQPLEIDQEKRIADMVKEGASTRVIAEELGMSQSTASRKVRAVKDSRMTQ